MIGIIISTVVVIYFFSQYYFGQEQNYNIASSNALLATAQFLIGYYTFCLITGAVAKWLASKGETKYKKILAILHTIGYSWSTYILKQSWKEFIGNTLLFIGASSLIFGSGRFDQEFIHYNLFIFLSGVIMLTLAIVMQRYCLRRFTEDS